MHLHVHCSYFTHNNYIKTKIVLFGICTVGYSFFNAVWFYLRFLPLIMIAGSVSYQTVVTGLSGVLHEREFDDGPVLTDTLFME